MRKKLLAGVMALALCSTNMPPQTIFAQEFTSGNPEEVSEVFTDTNQESVEEELSVFASESVPEFSSETNIAPATTDVTESTIDIDLTDPTNSEYYDAETGRLEIDKINGGGSYRFKGSGNINSPTTVPIRIRTSRETNIYLNNVYIVADLVPALDIQTYGIVNIYLENNNFLETQNSNSYESALKMEFSLPTIYSQNNSGSLTVSSTSGTGIRIGSGSLTINGGSVTASSSSGTGIDIGSGSLTIKSGSVKASSSSGTGIKSGSLTIEDGSVNAHSTFRTGIESDSLTIEGGSVKAHSTSGTGIKSDSLTIKGGSVTASSEAEQKKDISSNQITINGGSVNASFVSSSPTNAHGEKVYCCTIENLNSEEVKIDGNPKSWNPKNHNAVDSTDTNLYAWLTGKTHTISVGDTTQTYCFDKENKKFKPITNQSFTFTKPSDLTYDRTSKTASLQCNIPNMGAITLSYYKKGDNIPQSNGAVDAGTYTVKANIEGNDYYSSISDLTDSSWIFTINPALDAPGYTSETTKSVSWSCKKISEIPNLPPTGWIWNENVKPEQELQVGTPITATAIYNGSDKGNYQNKEITYTITREKCTHKHTAGRYYSSPSCTSSGYSGDTYCTDCGVLVSSGYTISAYGHDYDSGVITTEPTAETDGIITYTCKRCKHQDTKNLGKLGDGEPYIEGSFQKKGWDAVNDLIKVSKEKDTISITLNGSRTLPASVLSGIKGKDISLNLDMENGFIWKINGTSITAEAPADIDLSVTNTAEYIPAALYSLISTNQNDFGFHLGRSGAFDFPAVLSVKADASCAGLMANLFWYDVENGVLQCIQTVTVGGAFERSIPYADFTLSKGQDYFIAFGTESLNGRVIHTDGSITDENGAYLRPANTKISSHSIDRNKLTVKLSKGCTGAQGYDFVISKKSNMLQTGKFSKKVSSTGKPQASFRYLAKGTWYVAARSWVLDEQGNKVYGSWTKIKKIKITVVTPQQPKIKNITVKGNTVTVTYTKCKNATGYEILLGNKYKTSAGEKYPVKKYLKRTEGKNTVTVTFTNVKKGTWYVTIRAWNQTSKDKSRAYSPYSTMKKFKTKK